MPIFSNITNLPTYPINRNSNPLLQNELPQNCSSAEQQNIPTGSSPIDYTLQYPICPNIPYQPIRGRSIAPPPFPTLLTKGIPITGPYHVDSDEEDPNDIRYSPVVPTTNPTRHSDFAKDVITQSNLDIRDFEYAWRVPPHIVLRTTRGHYFELQKISGTLEDPIPILHDSEAHIVFRPIIKTEEVGMMDPPTPTRTPSPMVEFPFSFQPPPPIIKAKDDMHILTHQPAGAISVGQQTPYPAQHAEPIIIKFGTITALATLAILLPSVPPPAYFSSTSNIITQPIAPKYAEYINAILHHLENLTMSYGRNPETSLLIREYIHQIKAVGEKANAQILFPSEES
ncbi:hypothetical protein AX16_009849 [Volvariella volvacea WC 439]|nr:hypothetical protein AX16_009849 [Volvariella volvacea WC 439]